MPTPKPSPLRSTRALFILAALVIPLILITFAPSSHAIPEAPVNQWSRTYGQLEGHSVVQTSDGGYAVAGSSFTSAFLLKTDTSGEFLWEKNFGTEIFGGSNDAVAVVQTKDTGYTLFGEGGYIVHTDSEGNFTWGQTIGFKGVKFGIMTTEGNYVLAGNMLYKGENAAWLLKLITQAICFGTEHS